MSPTSLRPSPASTRRILTGVLLTAAIIAARSDGAELRGSIVDANTGEPLPARLYIVRVDDGSHHFAKPAAPDGEGVAVIYDKQNWINERSVERHTALGAHPFAADLEPGTYRLTAARGTEYVEAPVEITIAEGAAPAPVELPLRRWIDMAARRWYSGDTHVHRPLADLPAVMLAEDLNVAFPLTHWVTKAFTPPARGDRNLDAPDPDAIPKLITVGDHHVIWPLNTEYEIFTVDGKPHTLGAVFVLNQRKVLDLGVPPVGQVAAEAHAQGALLDMDKHDWPWALCLPPLMGIDLYELANNHLWRTEFAFTKWNAPAPDFMGLSGGTESGDERDWIEYTHRTYWMLLNLGFRLVPTAGTANGVHPVPLGFGRVYAHVAEGFSYEGWIEALRRGRTFVTTGPVLLASLERLPPGSDLEFAAPGAEAALDISVTSPFPPERIEVIVDGVVVHAVDSPPAAQSPDSPAFEASLRHRLRFERSGWVAVRSWESRESGRPRFAHSAPWFVTIPDHPPTPRREEVDYFVRRVRDEIERSRGVLPEAAIEEFESAARRYAEIGAAN